MHIPPGAVKDSRGRPDDGRLVDVVRHHHERWDGSGYPAGLAGEAIPLDVAGAEISRGAGTQFDPGCVEALPGLERAALARRLA